MSLAKRAVSGFNWQLLTLSCQAIATIVFMMLKSRIISKEAFGIFAIVNVLIALLQMLTEFGFGAALIQRKENKPAHISFAFYFTMLFAIFLYGLIVISASFIVSFFGNKFDTSVILAVGLNVIILGLGVVSKSLIIRDMEFKKLFLVVFVSNFIGNLIGIVLALYGCQIWALISINLCMNMLSVIFAFALKPHSVHFIFDITAAKEIFNFGAGLTLLRVFSQLSNHVDKLIIGKSMDASVLGVYERSLFIAVMPRVYVGSALDGVLFSTLSKIQSEQEKTQYIFFRLISLMVLFIGYIGLTTFFFSEEVIIVILGNQWTDGKEILQILAFLIFFQIFSRFSDTLVRAKNALYQSSIVKFIFLLVTIVGLYVGVPHGILVVSWIMVLAAFIHSFLMLRLCIKVMKASWGSFLMTLIPGLKLMAVLGIKNWLYIQYALPFINGAFTKLLVGVSIDLVLVLIFLKFMNSIFGKENLHFLIKIIENINFIKPGIKEKIKSYLNLN